MRYRYLGGSGLKVSVVGLGGWQAGFKSWGRDYTLNDIIDAYRVAIDSGINFIDTAEIYGDGRSEEVIGMILREYRDIIVATKVAGYNATPRGIIKAAERSRRRLGVDSIDLFQIHWPPSIYTKLRAVARAMEETVRRGLVKYIGLSNFPPKLLEDFIGYLSRYEAVSNQVQYNLLYRVPEEELIPLMDRNNVTLIAWSPLAKGALAGKTRVDNNARRFDLVFKRGREASNLLDTLRLIAGRHRVGMGAIALAWLVSKGAIPIPGVKRAQQALENASAGDIVLSSEEVSMLDRASQEFIHGEYKTIMPRLIPNFLQRLALRMIGGI